MLTNRLPNDTRTQRDIQPLIPRRSDTSLVASVNFSLSTDILQVVGRGYLGRLLADGLSLYEPRSITTVDRPWQREGQVFILASGPSSVAVTAPELEIWRQKLRNWIEWVTTACKRPRVIYISSAGTVYGSCSDKPATEITLTVNSNAYGRYHLWAERELLGHFSSSCAVVRLSNIYGPNQMVKSNQGFVTACVRAILKKTPIILYGDGENERDYVFERDVVMSIRKVVRESLTGIINLSSGVSHSQTEVIDIVSKQFNSSPLVIKNPSRSADIRISRVSNKKISTLLGISKFTSLAEGVSFYKGCP